MRYRVKKAKLTIADGNETFIDIEQIQASKEERF